MYAPYADIRYCIWHRNDMAQTEWQDLLSQQRQSGPVFPALSGHLKRARAHPPSFCGSNFRPPSTAHCQQPTIDEASGSHCFVSKPDRAIRVIWEPIAGIELIIQITNVIRRENVAPHYKDSYAKESLSE